VNEEELMSQRWVLDFEEGDGSMRDLLGGKGAGLAEMTRIGLRVPPGFTATTDACRYVMRHGATPPELWEQVDEALRRLEAKTGRTFGSGPAPLLVSVRSGAKFSMPGMMDTVLNLGINDDVLPALIAWADDERFAYDAYRRFLSMYSDVVLGIDGHRFQSVLTELRKRRGVKDDSELTIDDLREATERFKAAIAAAGGVIPTDPRKQLQSAIQAVFDSWNNPRAFRYRRIHDISDDLGTAANVQMMVFGDLGEDSGTGVCFTRDPATGERRPFGDYLPVAQGEDVVAGIRNTLTLEDFGRIAPALHDELIGVMDGLERHTRDMCDIEFTVERGSLWVLQTRAGKRTAAAAVRMAVEMADEALITQNEAVLRVDPSVLEQLERPRLADSALKSPPLAIGVAASPGAAQGEAVFDADRAVAARADGRRVLLVRPETTPDDIHGMDAADGILTSQGGKTSHAAVVARGMGKPAVTGAAALVVNLDDRTATVGSVVIHEGEPVTIDGTSGRVYVGMLPLVEPEPTPELSRLLGWADAARTLGVRANADTPADAAKARHYGAEGIGLARTEHMFMGQRLEIVQKIILAEKPADRVPGLEELKRLQTEDFVGLLEAMDGLPVVIRLLDPPLHEFLPSMLELEHQMVDRARHGEPTDDLEALEAKVAVWAEDNPMLGLRGVRLGVMVEDLYRMQAEAAVEAAGRRLAAGGDPRLEIMIPLVSTTEELRRMKEMVEEVVAKARAATGMEVEVPVGTMIELPRAALIAGDIARIAAFFSFGTNDLTQMTFGLSRDDAEGLFLGDYLEKHILDFDPFHTVDVTGVGRLIRMATKEGREANPGLTIGVCGEHGGDPASIRFFREVGLDYVSCSPPRVHVARLAAAQAELGAASTATV
jgi:pyruvate,orthophosphate dikinase